MATRPIEFIDWVPSGNPVDVIEPPSGQKNSGWQPGEIPPAQYENWVYYILDQWVQWLDQITTPQLLTVTSNQSLPNTAGTVFANTSGGAITALTLPAAAGNGALRMTIKNIGIGSGNNATILPFAGDNIENQASVVLAPGDYITVVSDGASTYWQIG